MAATTRQFYMPSQRLSGCERQEAFDSLIDALMATLTSETKSFGDGTGVSLTHSELIDTVAVRVIHRLKELIPERWEQAVSNSILSQLGAAELRAPTARHATDSAGQPGI